MCWRSPINSNSTQSGGSDPLAFWAQLRDSGEAYIPVKSGPVVRLVGPVGLHLAGTGLSCGK